MKFKKLLFLSILVLCLLGFLANQFSLTCQRKKLNLIAANYIEEKLNEYGFEASVVVRPLSKSFSFGVSSNPHLSLNQDEPVSAASLIKVPLMAVCFLAEAEGKMDLQEIYSLRNSDKTSGSGKLKSLPQGTEFKIIELIEKMTSESDNTSSNVIIKKLGFEYINGSFQKLGLKDTRIGRLVMDLNKRKKGVDNYVSARDIVLLLEKIYRKELVNKKSSETMLKFLLNQKVNNRIPRHLPKGTEVAHKTGTIRGIVHDAGIVFTRKIDFIICILTKKANNYKQPKDFIAEVSEFVYYLFVYGN